jgi:hypothetical protein
MHGFVDHGGSIVDGSGVLLFAGVAAVDGGRLSRLVGAADAAPRQPASARCSRSACAPCMVARSV